MTTLYVSQRRPEDGRQSRTTHRHHIGWGIVCAILMVVVTSLWMHAQTLATNNRDLQHQLAAALAPPSTCVAKTKLSASTSTRQSVQTRDGKREFTVHAPVNFENNRYYPLIFLYGGRGASPIDVELTYGMNNLPAIVVYPFPTVSKDGDFAWEGAPYSSDADDISFTRAILDKLEQELCVDETRIYATGFSNGGGFMSKLSCEMPDRFAAYVIIAGAMYSPTGECKPSRAAPLMTVHGDHDQIVPFAGSTIRNLPPIYNWTAWRASVESCDTRPAVKNIDQFRVQTTWKNCREDATIKHIRILGGLHAWGNVPNNTIWRFMSQHSLR